MKDKPVSHKNQNTFRFETFSERISRINIDVIHEIGKSSSSPEEINTFFLEAIEKWVDLNYSQDYVDLQKEIGSEIRNLSQIVFRKDEIIGILLKYLKKQDSLALDAVLELTVALARDLQSDFYPHFPEFFSALVLHLSSKDTELLEKLFTCLAYLFKFLWRYMVKDIKNVYRLFSSLLSDEQREHIRIFAVESFAFLIRKVQNKENLFRFIFKELKKNPEKSSGVGQLFFEVLKGVKEQFHSCTETVLKLLFEFLGDQELSPELIKSALLQTVTAMAKHTSKNYCLNIQKIFCNVIEGLLSNLQESDHSTMQHLNDLLDLFSFWINFKGGKLVSPEKSVVQVLIKLCRKEGLSASCLKTVVEIVASVIVSDCLSLSHDEINTMVISIYSQPLESFLHFTKNVLKYGMFEKDILPHLLSACAKHFEMGNYERKLSLEILAETVVSLKPIDVSRDYIKSFTKLYFCLPDENVSNPKSSSKSSTLESTLLEILSPDIITKSELPDIWAALVCLSHLKSVNEKVSSKLQKLAVYLHKEILLLNTDFYWKIEEYSFVLCQVYLTYLILCKDSGDSCFNEKFFIQLLGKHPNCSSILRSAELCFSKIEIKTAVEDVIDMLSNLIPNLSSPFHLVRLFTLKILNIFSYCFAGENQECSVFSICFEAEKIPLDVQSYREKLKFLRKLEYEFLEKQFSTKYEEHLKKVPVYYLIGMLYVNFRLLWEPAMDILESYAHGATKEFWEVYGNHLCEITEMCEKNDFIFKELCVTDESDSVFHQCLLQFCRSSENPDIGNHRILLWKAMEKFPDVVEPKNKTLVPLVFKLMGNEFAKVDCSVASKESISMDSNTACAQSVEIDNIKTLKKGLKRKIKQPIVELKKRKCLQIEDAGEKISDEESVEDMDEDIENADKPDNLLENSSDLCTEDIDDHVENADRHDDLENSSDISDNESEDDAEEVTTVKNVANNSSCWTKRKYSVIKTLASYLTVLSKFKNPKAIYRTEDLQKLYNELLSYHDPVVQKLAFDCIMTYNFKYLTSYKENFYRILDNKTFKSEVVLFSLDKQNEVIREEDRMNVLAVLMRILYGKMLHKTGNNTTGKSQANARRSLVLRFLAGCTADELKMFFDLVFMPFQELLNDSTLVAVQKIRNHLDFSSIVPLRRQHSALNSLGLIFQHLGNLVPELLPWLLKVLLVITATSMTLLEKRSEVLPHCVNLLKSIRTLAIMKLIQFFKTFSKYEFHPEEIDAVFEAIVWPMVSRLEIESVNQPSPLLHLLSTWSENPKYFTLLSKHDEAKSLSPLPHLIALYSSSRAKPRVVGAVAKIIYHLITAEDSLAVKEESAIDGERIDQGKDNCGIKLLLPFVDSILQRLEVTIITIMRKKSKKLLSPRDLTILLRISSYIEDSEQCSKLINLLVPFFHKPKFDAESEVFILNTIANLIMKVEDPDCFMKLFAPLFGKLTNQNSRTALANVFITMAEKQKTLSEIAVIIKKINAFDLNMLEEPDYQLRLEGHKEALHLIKSVTKNRAYEHFIRIIIYNSTFMIRMLDDMALRNSSSHLLVELTKFIATLQNQQPELFNMLIFETLLPEIHKGLKCTSEVKRHEFIIILSAVLSCCKDQPRLKELVALCHSDKDLDFWENIRHLQVHRRARALLRFSNILKTQHENKEKVNLHYLLTYMIPIVQSFLFDEAYKKHVHVIDAAIETLGSIASVLTWHHYELLLKQYLDLISKDADHHKTIIKIIVSLLNAFPYNLNAPEKAALSDIDSVMMSEDTTKEKGSTEEESPVSKDTSSGFNELTPELSRKINISIRKNILPLLHRSLMKKTKHDDEHKLAGHYYPEDEEILRVPIALAMVKLLQKLPSGTLEKALPGLFLKMCELLKSRTESIRQTTRETLIKMMQSLGPKYFYFLLKEMKGVMKKGYQVHVMIFTINAVLTNIADQLSSGDLDDCLQDLSEICMNELFSDIAEEKEVTKITGKVKEARSTKSYSIFQVISKYISESLLLDLILPLKEALFTKHSYKSLKKISECLRHIAIGVSENTGLSDKKLLIFTHSIASENIPALNSKKNKTSSKDAKYERPDIYLVPKEPGRSGPPAKINQKTNIHVLVEFGLQILWQCLKKDKMNKEEKEVLQMLDPFISLLAQCLSSNHIKIISTALRCLLPLYKYPLPSFKELTKKIVDSLFILINKYASPGMGQGENFEMIVVCFKMLTMLVRDTNYHKFTDEQLHSLLSYVEQDIYDYTRQATAFSLLKAILCKKIQSSELPGIMSKVGEMAITSEQENVRAQCRQLCMQYMLDYPLGKKLVKSISFFIAQLEYPHEHGRISCMEIINSMMNMFPENVLKSHAALYLVPLSARLVNDETSKCRKMAAQCIKKLLEKIDHDGRAGLFSIALNWLQDKKMSHKRLGAQLCGLFAEVEGEQFEHHLLEILPIYSNLINDVTNTEVEKETDERCSDHFLYHLLNSLIKMLSFCSVIRKSQYSKIFNDFWEQLQRIILYPHMWVSLAASQLFGLLLSSYSIKEIQEAIVQEDEDTFINSKQKLLDLCGDFSTQIQSPLLNETLGNQVVRNLICLLEVASELTVQEELEPAQIKQMIYKICKEAYREVAKTPHMFIKRKVVFMFLAGIAHQLKKKILPYLKLILNPLCREVADASKNADKDLKKDAEEALNLIRDFVGVEEFSEEYAKVQKKLLIVKSERKSKMAQEAITNPERYSKRKIKKQLSKKESKKRKMLKQKGKKKPKKAKLADIVIAT